ncbi:MAG: hypothetical protein NTV44_05440 [Firmicutes bacterium]|nr:hypothetical protein [Bacillota bacterium]
MTEQEPKNVVDAEIVETGKKTTMTSEIDPLHAWAYLLFFLPWCHGEKKSDHELDNWFANQGLLNFIGWMALSAASGILFFFGPLFVVVLHIFSVLILANALYGVISYYQGKRVKMLVYGDIHLIPTKII